MMTKQKKGIAALIIVMIVFLSAAIFLTVSFQNPKATATTGDVEYLILVEGNGSVTVGDEVFTDAGGTLSSNQTVEFLPEKYYEFSVIVIWSGGPARINGNVINEPYTCITGENYITYLSIQPSELVSQMSVTFVLKETEYKISTAVRYISNSSLSESTDLSLEDALSNETIVIGLNKQKVKLGDDAIVTLFDTSGLNHRFYDYALLNKTAAKNPYEFQGLSENGNISEIYTITINKDFLDKYLLAENEIVIYGAFIKTFSVKTTDYADDSYFGNFIEATITNDFTGYNKKFTSFSADPINVDEGSYIKLTALNIPYFKFDYYTVTEGSNITDNIKTSEYVIGYLKADYMIIAKFSKKDYNLSIDGQDSLGRSVDLTGGLTINGQSFNIGDTITIELSNALLQGLIGQNLHDNRFSIKVGLLNEFIWLSDVIETELTVTGSTVEILITKEFLDKYLNLNSATIKILANFSLRYNFSITLSDMTGLGSGYTISIKDKDDVVIYSGNHSGNYTHSNPLNYGTFITIVLTPHKYAAINSVNVYETERKNDNTIEIVLNNSNRHINISFAPALFSIQDTTESEGYAVSSDNASHSLEDLSIGNIITISVGVADNDEIKKWILKSNGKSIDILNDNLSAYGAEYANNSLTIVITKEWLDEFGYNISSEITKGMKISILAAIIAPSIAIPVLIVLLIIIFTTNAKRKKFIKAELLDEKMAGYTYNAGSMIKDLRDDSFNKVSKADIKAEMKKRNDHKK